MNEVAAEESPKTPFDDFPGGKGGTPVLHLARRITAFLRVLSGLALVFAFVTAAGILVLDACQLVRPDLPWKIKSALPLIGIGLSYALLQVTLRRRMVELCLGLAVSLAFVLWGAEQFAGLPRIASLMDDVVVFLFVLDLSVVIQGRLREK